MHAVLLDILQVLMIAAFIPALLLQFLPPRYTVNKGALATIETWRSTLWCLPFHMLSSFGKKLRFSMLILCAVDAVIFTLILFMHFLN